MKFFTDTNISFCPLVIAYNDLAVRNTPNAVIHNVDIITIDNKIPINPIIFLIIFSGVHSTISSYTAIF